MAKTIQQVKQSKSGHKSITIPKKFSKDNQIKEGDYVVVEKLDAEVYNT